MVRRLSPGYGDIEVEAKIAPEGYPNGRANAYGAAANASPDPTGRQEGNMHLRLGTVMEMEETKYDNREPPASEYDQQNGWPLKSRWYRMIQFTPRQAAVAAHKLTMSLGARVVQGRQYAGRSTDTAALSRVRRRFSDPDAAKFQDPYLAEEISARAVNRKIETDPQHIVWVNAIWLVGDHPTDIEANESWVASRPPSLEIQARGYAGVIEKSPGEGDFPNEPPEFEDDPNDPKNEFRFAVHFVNALADVDHNGKIEAADQNENKEQDQSEGLFVNERIDPGNSYVAAGASTDPSGPANSNNMGEIQVRLSEPPSGYDYGDHELWMRFDSSVDTNHVNFWRKDASSGSWGVLPFDGTSGYWKIEPPESGIEADGSPITLKLWHDEDNNVASANLEVFLVGMKSGGQTPEIREAMDVMHVTFMHWGLDVDSDNDRNQAGPDADDNAVEDEAPGLVMPATAGTPGETADSYSFKLRLRKRPDLAVIPNAKAVLKKSVGSNGKAGAVRILDAQGVEVLSVGAGESTEYEVPIADITGAATAFLDYTIEAVDGTTEAGPCIITWELQSGDEMIACDKVLLTVVEADLGIKHGFIGEGGGTLVDDDDEFSEGAVTVANLNDSDEDGTQDHADTAIGDDLDLMELTLGEPMSGSLDAVNEVRILVVNEGRVYEKTGTATVSDMSGTDNFTKSISMSPTQTWPVTRWAEMRDQSWTALRRVTFELQAKTIGPNPTWVTVDRVRATGIWIDFLKVYKDEDMPSGLDDTALKNLINLYQGTNPNDTGFGPIPKVQLPDGNPLLPIAYGFRGIFEFQIQPQGVWDDFDLRFSITRSATAKDRLLRRGALQWETIGDDIAIPSSDAPNDPNSLLFQDIVPNSVGRIYSFDAPSIQTEQMSSKEIVLLACQRFSAVEFARVRMKFGSNVFTNTRNMREGTRASSKVDGSWHMQNYIRRKRLDDSDDTTQDFEHDATNETFSIEMTAASPPALFFSGSGQSVAATFDEAPPSPVTSLVRLYNVDWLGPHWFVQSNSGKYGFVAPDANYDGVVEVRTNGDPAGAREATFTMNWGSTTAPNGGTLVSLFRTARTNKSQSAGGGALVPAVDVGP